jgi:gliding motility-associated-like protein
MIRIFSKGLTIFFLFIQLTAFSQQIIDSCFSSATVGTSFPSSATLVSLDADLMQWNGSSWSGGWPGANITIPPPAGGSGCRAIWCGSGSAWTTGGEGFALQLNAPLVAGQSYTFNFTTVSHGTGSNGSFSPRFSTNNSSLLGSSTFVGNLTPAGNSWVTNPFTFTATAAQAGHNWIIIHSGAAGSSGFVNNLCVSCNVPQVAPCNVDLGPDLNLCPGQTATLNATTAGATYAWQNGSTSPTFTVTQAGTYTVTINVNGCTDTDAVTVNYGLNPTVNLGSDVTLCPGQTLTLNATNPSSTYLWQNGSTAPTFTVTQPGTYSVAVTNSCSTVSDNIVVAYDVLPQVDLGPDQTICSGETVFLDATFPNSTYLWQDNSTNATLAASQTGNYTVVVTNSCGSATDNINISAISNLTIDLGPDATICSGESLILDATTVGGTYLWQDNSNGSTLTVTQSGTYSVEVSTSCGILTDEIVVIVLSAPEVNLGNDTSFCEGGTLLLDATNPNTTYVWQDNSTLPTLLVDQSGIYSVTATNSIGCTASDEITVIVDQIPVVSAGPDVTICQGQSVTLLGSGASTYSWSNNVTNGVAFTPSAGATTYTVTGTTLGGCTDTDDVIVTVGNVPNISFHADVTSGCVPLTVQLTNTTPSATSCVWTLSDGTIISGCGTVEVIFEQGGCFDVTLTTELASGCFGSFTAVDYICAQDIPNADFMINPQQVSSLQPNVQFNNLSSGAATYFWSFGDNSEISTETNPSHSYPFDQPGSYPVMLIANSTLGCSDTAYSYVEVLEELIYYVPNSFTPDGDIYNQTFEPVFTSGFDPFNYNFMIFNRWGEMIFESNDPTIGWDGSYTMNGNVHTCHSGVYTWRIEYKRKNNDEKTVITGHVSLLR